eukprot:TRINITY_DN1527_c0_g1_i1.p1 TRINITY_DN1527_c0_g1~~TRINITY_DN1527_c0_g1_i1.p1  ORF type:complete len:116 (+),score=0.24 TRINITY_DN1527_c0_g1_i1:16-363(+)
MILGWRCIIQFVVPKAALHDSTHNEALSCLLRPSDYWPCGIEAASKKNYTRKGLRHEPKLWVILWRHIDSQNLHTFSAVSQVYIMTSSLFRKLIRTVVLRYLQHNDRQVDQLPCS